MPSSRPPLASGQPSPGRDLARSVWRESLALGLVLALWLFSTSWVRPLGMPDEGRYVGVAWEMVRSGDWLTPTLNGLPYFHKPPLFYWITALSLSASAVNAMAALMKPATSMSWLAYCAPP